MKRHTLLKTWCGVALVSLICSTFLFAEDTNDDYWDGEDYHRHSSSQKYAASDLMKYIPLAGSETILDVGCGDGKITAAISRELPEGKMLGVDISLSMISFAKAAFPNEQYPNLDFVLMGAEDIDFNNQFDIVVSFTALQWVKDHPLVIRNVIKSLRPKGLFGVTMPMGLPAELELAVNETIQDGRWSGYFLEFDTGWNFIDKASYDDLLRVEGFTSKRIQAVRQEDIFPSLAVFKGFISQWFPYLRPLPSHLREEFMECVLSRYTELEPLDELGRLHFKINRLEVVAEKN